MTITTTKSWKNYITLCNVLERNDIGYERDDKDLCVKCNVIGNNTEMNMLFAINPSKMLITLFCPISIKAEKEKMADMALAVCMVNNTLADGSFCLDTRDGLMYYKVTSSFYESNVNETVFEYMLSTAVNTVDEYYEKFDKLAKSDKPFNDSYDSAEKLNDDIALYFMTKNLIG